MPMRPIQKMMLSSWSKPKEGNVYGKLVVDPTNALNYLYRLRQQTRRNITLTQLFGKICADALEEAPELNTRILFGKVMPRKTIDVCFLVSADRGEDLWKVTIREANKKSLVDLSEELQYKSQCIKLGKAEDYERGKQLLKILPTWVVRKILNVGGFFSSGLGLSAKSLGFEAYQFGSCIISSVGVLGIEEAYIPPAAFHRVPLYFLIGSIKEQSVVIDGKSVIRPQLTITTTIDHRFIWGAQVAIFVDAIRERLNNPSLLDNVRLDKNTVSECEYQ